MTLPEPDLHLHLIHLELVDEAIHLVDEENRPDPLLQCLSKDGFGLGHRSFNRIDQYHCTIHCTHSPGYVTSEVHVPGGIYHVDKEFMPLVLVHHGDVARINSDATRLLLLIRVHEELFPGKFF